MTVQSGISGYRWDNAQVTCAHHYLLSALVCELTRLQPELLRGVGFIDICFERAGRVPALAKSMIAVARRP